MEVHERTFTPLHITNCKDIERVAELAAVQEQPIIHDGILLYKWRPGMMSIADDDAELLED